MEFVLLPGNLFKMLYPNKSHAQKNEKNKVRTFSSIFFYLAIISIVFWVSLSIFLYAYLYTPFYGNYSKILLTSSSAFFFKVSFVIFLSILFSALIGLFTSIPAIMLNIFLIFKLEKRMHHGQKPVIFIFINKYLPVLFLLLTNLFFVFYNFSISPNILLNFVSKNNYIFRLSCKFQEIRNSKNKVDYYQIGKKVAASLTQDSNYIFFMPEEMINNPEYFQLTKILLKNKGDLILTNSNKSDMVSSIFNLYPTGNFKLFSPVPIGQSFERSQDKESYKPNGQDTINKNVFIGTDLANVYKFGWLFHENAVTESIKLTWYDVFLNRFAISQPQFLYFFKCGLASHFSPLWKWANIYNTNSNLLSKYYTSILKSNKNLIHNLVFYFTEFSDSNQDKLLKQFQFIPKNAVDFQKEIHKEDLYFAGFIGGILSTGPHNIILFPYIEKNKNVQFHSFYYSNGINLNQSPVFQNLVFTPHSLQNSVLQQQRSNCIVKNIERNMDDYGSKLINKLDIRKEHIFLDEKYKFYIESQISKSFFCSFKEGDRYYITLDFSKINPNDFNYGDIYSKIFQSFFEQKSLPKSTISKIEFVSEKRQELFNYEFFKHLLVFKIDISSLKLIPLKSNFEKEIFFKNHGIEIMNEMYKYENND